MWLYTGTIRVQICYVEKPMAMDYEVWEKNLITTKKIISYMTYKEDWVRIIGTLGQINFSTFKSSPIDLMTGKKTVSFEYKRSAHI